MGWAMDAFWRDLERVGIYPDISDSGPQQQTGVEPRKGRLYMSNESKKEFSVSTEYQGYVFLGWASGMFEPRPGRRIPYYNMFVFSPVSTYESDDYKASGFKAEKKKCLTPDVWDGLTPGDKVRLFFDDKGRVITVALDG